MAKRKPIKAVIFDMDGLLIDSEKMYTQITNEVLAPYGKVMTWEIKSAVMGLPTLAAAQRIVALTGVPLTAPELVQKASVLQSEMFKKVAPMPGALRLVRHLSDHDVPIAIATGSNKENFKTKTSHLPDLFSPFKDRVVLGDDARLKRGKPNPDVFLLAAAAHFGLAVGPDPQTGVFDPTTVTRGGTVDVDEVLVFEDGVPGVQAAVSAGMPTVWVPDRALVQTLGGEEKATRELAPSEVLGSLEEFKPEAWGLPGY